MKYGLFCLFVLAASIAGAATYPTNHDCGQVGDFLWKAGVERGRTANITPIGPFLMNFPESPGSSHEGGIELRHHDVAYEFVTDLCSPPRIAKEFQDLGQPLNAHATFVRLFPKYGPMLFGGGQERGFTYNPKRKKTSAQLSEFNPWPEYMPFNITAQHAIECDAQSWWTYGFPEIVDWKAFGRRCQNFASWDHLDLTNVSGFTLFHGNLMMIASDQQSTGLAIYDVSNRADPQLLSIYKPTLKEPSGNKVGLGGYWVDFYGANRLVWAARPIEQLNDPSNPASLTPTRTHPAIEIVNFSDPKNPFLSCYIPFESDGSSDPMYVNFQDQYAYVDHFRVDILACEAAFADDQFIDKKEYAQIVTKFDDILNGAECSQYARPLGQIVICGGYDWWATSARVQTDGKNLSDPNFWFIKGGPRSGSNFLSTHEKGGVIVGRILEGQFPEAGDVLDDREGTRINVLSVDRSAQAINEQGMSAFVQYEEPDSRPPYVSGSLPADGTNNYPTTAWIHFHIPETIRSESAINAVTLTNNNSGKTVAIDVQYSHTGTWTVQPRKKLKTDTSYTVRVAGVQDFMGNTMEPHAFSFTTGDNRVVSGESTLTANAEQPAPSYTGKTYYPNTSAELACEPEKVNGTVWVVNPDNDTVTLVERRLGAAPNFKMTHRVKKEIATPGAENPTSVSKIANEFAVTYRDSGKVIVYNAKGKKKKEYDFGYGSQPVSSVAHGNSLYVALYGDQAIAKIDHSAQKVQTVLSLKPGDIGLDETINATPKAMALTQDGLRLLVTRQISSEEKGLVYDINTRAMSLTRTITVNKVQVADDIVHGSGVPNHLNKIVISPDERIALVTGFKHNIDRGLVKNGLPLDDDNTVRPVLVSIDLVNHRDTNVDPRTPEGTVDFDNAADLASITYLPDGNSTLVALRGNNTLVVKDLKKNKAAQFPADKAPTDMCTTLRTVYVKNYTSRTVSAIDIADWMFDNRSSPKTQVIETVSNEILSPQELAGLQVFYHSMQPEMGVEGYMSCASCHFDSGHDGMTWDMTALGEGLRNTLSLNGQSGVRFGNLHWSSNFDEVQDFEKQIEELNRGKGLIGNDTTMAGLSPLDIDNAGRDERLDNLAAYITGLGKDSLRHSPYKNDDGTLTAAANRGRALFNQYHCASCHTPPAFTDSQSHNVGTIVPHSGQRLGKPLKAIRTPRLTELWMSAPYFHDGSASTLIDTITRQQSDEHNPKLNQQQQLDLVAYLRSIDREDFIDDLP